MAHWYEKSSDLLKFEKQCWLDVLHDFNNPQADLKFDYDCYKRFCVELTLPITVDDIHRIFQFHIVYMTGFPSKKNKCPASNLIRIYPMGTYNQNFHHLLRDQNGIPYVCQAEEVEGTEINGYTVAQHLLRWCTLYILYENRGVTLDV